MSLEKDFMQKLKEAFKDQPIAYPDLEKYYIETQHHMGSEKEDSKSIFLTSENCKLIIGKRGTGKTTSLRKTLMDLEEKDFHKISIEAPNPLILDDVLSKILVGIITTLKKVDKDFPSYNGGMSYDKYMVLLKQHSLRVETGKSSKRKLSSTISGWIAKITGEKETSESEKTVVIFNKLSIEEKKKMMVDLLEYLLNLNHNFVIGLDHIFITNEDSIKKFSEFYEVITKITDKASENLSRATTNEKIIYIFVITTDMGAEKFKDSPQISLPFDVIHEMDYINFEEAKKIVSRRFEEVGITFQEIFETTTKFEEIYKESGGNLRKLINLVLNFCITKGGK